jgi:hypothetical protein
VDHYITQEGNELRNSGGRYLSSNVEIMIDGESVTVGARFAKFQTEQ